jgi:hypothetical protein
MTTTNQFAGLQQAIIRKIVQRTAGRIQHLKVDVSERGVVVHGCVSSYHIKQLALQGIQEGIGDQSAAPIELAIQVLAHEA